jgi:hypothetical protein
MPDNDAVQAAPAIKGAVPNAPDAFPLAVEEFCQHLSSKVKLPEMIYAFSKHEIAEGRLRDTAKNYTERFNAFGGRIPV